MKPCRKQNMPAHRQTPSEPSTSRMAQSVPETPVHRYVHPIRTTRPTRRSSTEEMLSYILESLSRQSELLEDLLRRMESDNSDTQ